MRPSLDALAAFEAVARHGSFTSAARELCVSQSAVSHRVRQLERDLGLRLLVRNTRSVHATEAGATLAAGVARGVHAIEAALSAIDDRDRDGTLNVSCSPSFAIRWLVRRLASFREQHPNISVRLDATDVLVAPASRGAAPWNGGARQTDVCIRYGAGGYPDVSVTRLSHEEVFVVASPALLAQRPLKRLSQLSDHVLLHHDVMRDHPEHVPWSRFLPKRAARDFDLSHGPRFSHAHMALEGALAGLGVALGRTTLVADDLETGRLVAPLRRRVPSGLAYWMLCSEHDVDEPHVAALRNWLRRELG